jgi:hypothetical protein
MVEKAFDGLAISKMRGDNLRSILGLDMSIENAFGFNDYIGTLLAKAMTTGEIHLGMSYFFPVDFFLESCIDGFGAAGNASCSLANENGARASHITSHSLYS